MGSEARMGSYENREDSMKTDTQEECQMRKVAEIVTLYLQAKEHLGLPKVGRGKGASFPRGFRGDMVLRKPLDSLISQLLRK